ncbi:hypothetical protein HELRODRAFT_181905 [Helobdella robusta]|uniref:Uncharacterized protein n=1 Tax=Helobdella robusta TaxID=6412 RepID=T1FHG3_HELRO|nr:hypothetical protein HELRODRAFT_181905 [Helobdella robusta]ESN91981.1 hypothetical protein HELRODRAFT_181905 [Helobdella robusta]
MYKKGSAMSLRRCEFQAERPKLRSMFDIQTAEFKTYMLTKPCEHQTVLEQMREQKFLEEASVREVSEPSPSVEWYPPSPSNFNLPTNYDVNESSYKALGCIIKGKKKTLLNLERPLENNLGRATKICFDEAEKDEEEVGKGSGGGVVAEVDGSNDVMQSVEEMERNLIQTLENKKVQPGQSKILMTEEILADEAWRRQMWPMQPLYHSTPCHKMDHLPPLQDNFIRNIPAILNKPPMRSQWNNKNIARRML